MMLYPLIKNRIISHGEAAVDLLTDNDIDSVEQLYETKISSLKGTDNLSEAEGA